MANICFFIANLNQSGGTERVTSVIASKLTENGNNVHILSLKYGGNPFFELKDNVVVDQLFTSGGYGLFRFPLAVMRLRSYLKKHEIDILIDVDSILALYAFPAMVGKNVRHICWEHFNYNVSLGKYSRKLARKLAARYADYIVTLTEYDKQLWINNTTCKAIVEAIPNPVTILPPEQVNVNKENVILAVGRLTHQKGFDTLLRSWARIRSLHSKWTLKIVGDGEDKDLLEKLRHDLKIEGSTELIPKTNNIAMYYKEAAFFVLSSRFEGFGLVILEAQLYGIPVISFDCEVGPRDIIQHDRSGWLCENGSESALSDLIKRECNLFESDFDRYILMSEGAIRNAGRYSLVNIINKWEPLINGKRK